MRENSYSKTHPLMAVSYHNLSIVNEIIGKHTENSYYRIKSNEIDSKCMDIFKRANIFSHNLKINMVRILKILNEISTTRVKNPCNFPSGLFLLQSPRFFVQTSCIFGEISLKKYRTGYSTRNLDALTWTSLWLLWSFSALIDLNKLFRVISRIIIISNLLVFLKKMNLI